MFGQALICKRHVFIALLIGLASTSGPSVAALADELPVAKNSETIIILEPPPPAWGFDIGFIQNGPRTGLELQGNAPQFGSRWMPQLGLGLQTIDIEGHLNSSTSESSETHTAGFLYASLKFRNPMRRGMVRPYGIAKLGALLTSDVAHSKATGAGYLGVGGEFPFSEIARGLFSGNTYERQISFFIETGVPITANAQATSMQGSPFIFNGISSTVGFKYDF